MATQLFERPEALEAAPPSYEACPPQSSQQPSQFSKESSAQVAQYIHSMPVDITDAIQTAAVRPALLAQNSLLSEASSAKSSATSPTTLSIPTNAHGLNSGFPYRSELFELRIPPTDWEQFNTELQAAARPDIRQQAVAITAGVGLGCVIFEPFTSTYVARRVWHGKTLDNVKKGIEDTRDERKVWGLTRETVGAVLRRWNARWDCLGVVAGIVVPDKDDVGNTKGLRWKEKRKAKNESKRFKIVLYKRGDEEDVDEPSLETSEKAIVAEIMTVERPAQELGGSEAIGHKWFGETCQSSLADIVDSKAKSDAEGSSHISNSPVELSAN